MAPAPLRRSDLNDLLKTVLGSDCVYFQPGPDTTMQFPCIVYERDRSSVQHADNQPFRSALRYQVTYMDYSPDSDVVAKLLALPLCSFNRHYATSGLNHDVFVLYH